MSDFSPDDVKEFLGDAQKLSVDGGGAAGHGISYEAKDIKVNGDGTVSASYKLNEGSLERARQKTGLDNPSSPRQTMDSVISKSESDGGRSKHDSDYAKSINKHGKLPRGFSGARNNYRAELSAFSPTPSPSASFPIKGPVARHERQLRNLRRTFNNIAGQPQKSVSRDIRSGNMPKAMLEKMAQRAIRTGAATTPAGPVDAIARMTGLKKSKSLREALDRWGVSMDYAPTFRPHR